MPTSLHDNVQDEENMDQNINWTDRGRLPTAERTGRDKAQTIRKSLVQGIVQHVRAGNRTK